jgi:predicted dehydrogenase
MSDQIGVGVIGSGYWGGNYVRVFTELPETNVVAVCDQRAECRDKISSRFPDVILAAEVDEFLQIDGIDIIVICTNATNHHEVAQQCIEAGKKHILLEKPMTTSVSTSEKLITLAKANNVTLMVGHIYLYNAAVRRVKSYVEERRIGQLYYMYAQRTNLGPIRNDVNALWDLAPHDVSIFNHLMDGPPDWVSAVGHKALRNQREDVGFIVLGYPNNVIGQIHVSWADPDKVRQIVAVGSEMRVVFNDINPQEPVRVYEKGVLSNPDEPSPNGESRFSIRNGDIISPRVALNEPLKEQCLHFLHCVQTGERPLTDGHNGLDVVRVMEAVDQSIALNGAPIKLFGEERGEHSEAELANTLR